MPTRRSDEAQRSAAQARGELLIPIVKGWCTEIGNEIAGVGVQVHGGMGFIEETGAAQYVRDVRITTIYEGTTGIQSNDLIGRKLGRDRGAAMGALLQEMERDLKALAGKDPAVESARVAALAAVAQLHAATQALLQVLASRPDVGMAVAVPYLKLCGYVIGGWLLAKSAAIAAAKLDGADRDFLRRQDQDRGVLRRAGAAQRRRTCTGGRRRRHERHRDRRRADLSASGDCVPRCAAWAQGQRMNRRELLAGGMMMAAAAAARGAGVAPDGALITRKVPSSGEELPVIGLGTSGPFEVGPAAAARAPLLEVLQGFFAAGARLIDTSPMYSTAEGVLGELLSRAHA